MRVHVAVQPAALKCACAKHASKLNTLLITTDGLGRAARCRAGGSGRARVAHAPRAAHSVAALVCVCSACARLPWPCAHGSPSVRSLLVRNACAVLWRRFALGKGPRLPSWPLRFEVPSARAGARRPCLTMWRARRLRWRCCATSCGTRGGWSLGTPRQRSDRALTWLGQFILLLFLSR